MTISAAIQAFCSMFEQVAKTKNTAIENQSESTVNKAIKRTTKAIQEANSAVQKTGFFNKALDIAAKYTDYMSKDDKKDFIKHKKKFDDNIGGK